MYERDGTCRRVAEEKARWEQKWKKDMLALEGILENKVANEIADIAGQFFSTLEQPETASEDGDGDGDVEEVEDIGFDLMPTTTTYF